jgi:hypothetical protein
MDELDDKLKALADEYHQPPALDRERVWARIGERRAARGEGRQQVDGRWSMVDGPAGGDSAVLPMRQRSPAILRRALAWGSAVAAVLALGFVLGRTSASPDGAPTVPGDVAATHPASTEAAAQNRALTIAAASHIRQAETYLTLFRASVQGGAPDETAIPAARQLLATNRLLASAPGADPKLRQLLLDLELVLVQIAQLEGTGRPEDVQLITDGLDRAGTLTRLRNASPRYPASLSTGVS